MIIETERLLLRPFQKEDAEFIYPFCADPDTGYMCGWPPHKDVSETALIIEKVLSGRECYAICQKEDDKPMGAIELLLKGNTKKTDREDECELGFWLGKEYRNNGYMTEAGKALLERAFASLSMRAVWCSHIEENAPSAAVQKKLGFSHVRTDEAVCRPLLSDIKNVVVNRLTREEW